MNRDALNCQLAAAMNPLPESVRMAAAIGKEEFDKLRQQKLLDQDFSGYLNTYGSHERFPKFVEIAAMLSPEQYWKILREVWLMVEVIQPDKPKWLKLLNREVPARDHLMTQQEHEALAKLPDDIDIWRGCGHKSGVRGLSWALNREQAESFASYACGERRALLASPFHGRTPIVVEATCHRSDVLALFLQRGESEIVVNPKNVTVRQLFTGVTPKADATANQSERAE